MTQEKKFFAPILHDYAGDARKRWRVEYRVAHPDHPAGKRVVAYGNINRTTDVQERYNRANALISKIYTDLKEEKITMLESVIEHSKIEWRYKTIAGYKTVVKYFSKQYPVHEIVTTEQIRRFLVSMKEAGSSNTTIKKYRDALANLYQRAIKLGFTKFNPVSIDIKIKKAPRSLKYFNDTQIMSILQESKERPELYLSILFLFYCFIRPAEQRDMKISWINFEDGYIEIPGEYSKNKKTEKVVIPIQLQYEIEHLKNYPQNFYVLSKTGKPDKQRVGTNYLGNHHRKILKRLKIVGRYALYSWKHTGVVKAVKSGINLKDIQLQLRHHSLDMVNEYLKNLGVLDSDALRFKFPTLGAEIAGVDAA